MKTLCSPVFLVLSLFIGVAASSRAQSAPTKPVPNELTLVIVESAQNGSIKSPEYDRIARVFTDVFEERKWPVKIKDERLAANAPEHELELRVYDQGIKHDTPEDITFRAWMILFDRGNKRDMGVMRFSFSPRAGESMDETLDKVVAGAARMAADRIEPVLFPDLAAPKK